MRFSYQQVINSARQRHPLFLPLLLDDQAIMRDIQAVAERITGKAVEDDHAALQQQVSWLTKLLPKFSYWAYRQLFRLDEDAIDPALSASMLLGSQTAFEVALGDYPPTGAFGNDLNNIPSAVIGWQGSLDPDLLDTGLGYVGGDGYREAVRQLWGPALLPTGRIGKRVEVRHSFERPELGGGELWKAGVVLRAAGPTSSNPGWLVRLSSTGDAPGTVTVDVLYAPGDGSRTVFKSYSLTGQEQDGGRHRGYLLRVSAVDDRLKIFTQSLSSQLWNDNVDPTVADRGALFTDEDEREITPEGGLVLSPSFEAEGYHTFYGLFGDSDQDFLFNRFDVMSVGTEPDPVEPEGGFLFDDYSAFRLPSSLVQLDAVGAVEVADGSISPVDVRDVERDIRNRRNDKQLDDPSLSDFRERILYRSQAEDGGWLLRKYTHQPNMWSAVSDLSVALVALEFPLTRFKLTDRLPLPGQSFAAMVESVAVLLGERTPGIPAGWLNDRRMIAEREVTIFAEWLGDSAMAADYNIDDGAAVDL